MFTETSSHKIGAENGCTSQLVFRMVHMMCCVHDMHIYMFWTPFAPGFVHALLLWTPNVKNLVGLTAETSTMIT